jgi:SAM-dependent methyltransferase
MESTRSLFKPRPDIEYRPFPNDEGKNTRQSRIEIPLFVNALAIPKGARILEIGCGRGIALPVLSELCLPTRLVGLDIDPELLAIAAEHTDGLNVELVQGDAREMPFPDGSFDVVIDFGTCYHIGSPEMALNEVGRVLSPGGIFCHETPLSQLMAHPVRWGGRLLPWHQVKRLTGGRRMLLWSSRRRAIAGVA